MGAHYLTNGVFVKAQVGEVLHGKQFSHTFAVVTAQDQPVCIPHEGCTLQMLRVDPGLADHDALGDLRSGQSVSYRIEGSGKDERDIITLKNGKIVDLKELGVLDLPDHRGEAGLRPLHPATQLSQGPSGARGAGVKKTPPPRFSFS